MFRWDHRLQIQNIFMALFDVVIKKNLKAFRPSENPSVKAGKMSKRSGGIIGCEDKTSSWHLIGFPIMVVTLRQQYHVREKPTVLYCTLLTSIAMQGHQTKQRQRYNNKPIDYTQFARLDLGSYGCG